MVTVMVPTMELVTWNSSIRDAAPGANMVAARLLCVSIVSAGSRFLLAFGSLESEEGGVLTSTR